MWENQKSVVVNFQSLERYTKESCRYLQNLLHQASVELYEANFLPFFEKKFATYYFAKGFFSAVILENKKAHKAVEGMATELHFVQELLLFSIE